MLDIRRHKQVFDAESFRFPIHIIGCGGMGSRMAEGLVRMGLGEPNKSPITLYDHDVFEGHNLTNQWSTVSRLNMNKVDAVRSLMLEINPQAEISVKVGKVQIPCAFEGVVFLCLDSMQVRRQVVDSSLAANEDVVCVIETRMDAGVGISHCFDPNDERQLACWRLYWHSDNEADNMQGCGGHQSIISAIYATTAMALKQFEQFARTKTTAGIANRLYHDFDEHYVNAEVWPEA